MDTLYPYFRVREDGYEAVVAGPQRRVYPLVMHEIPPGWDITRESPSYHLAATVAFSPEVDPSECAGLFLTGGRAPSRPSAAATKICYRIIRYFFCSRETGLRESAMESNSWRLRAY